MKHKQAWTVVAVLFLMALGSIFLGGWQINNGGGGSGTVTNTGGALTANAVVLGAGGADTKVSTGITSNGASEVDLGLNGTASGVLGLNGSTSGKATFTAPAVAGTVTNPIASSNYIAAVAQPSGLFTSPQFIPNPAHATAGLGENIGDNDIFLNAASGGCVTLLNNGSIGWRVCGQTVATGINCSAVGTAANPSVASCTGAPAGSFSCATNASGGTCTVNTTAVTANSQIFITQRSDTTTGTRLGVTCNTTLTTVIPEITAVTAATSFTINLGTITTNPECFSYFIVN